MTSSHVPDHACHDFFFCTESKHCKHHQSGQHRGEEVYEGDSEGIAVTVVVLGIVGGVGNDGSKAEAQSEENLRGRLPPHLNVCPDVKLWKKTSRVCQENPHICLTSVSQMFYLKLPWGKTYR